MDSKELKKILTTVSLAGLLAAGGAVMVGCATSCGKSSCASGKSKEKSTNNIGNW